MNIVLDNAFEVNAKKEMKKSIGRIMLKGDNLSLIKFVWNVYKLKINYYTRNDFPSVWIIQQI